MILCLMLRWEDPLREFPTRQEDSILSAGFPLNGLKAQSSCFRSPSPQRQTRRGRCWGTWIFPLRDSGTFCPVRFRTVSYRQGTFRSRWINRLCSDKQKAPDTVRVCFGPAGSCPGQGTYSPALPPESYTYFETLSFHWALEKGSKNPLSESRWVSKRKKLVRGVARDLLLPQVRGQVPCSLKKEDPLHSWGI